MLAFSKSALFLTIFMKACFCANDGLHETPPMGWSSWNTFSDKVNQEKIVATVHALKRLNLDTFGYIYLTVDDLWNLKERDPISKKMQVNPERFPSGMKYLSNVIHEAGLKFGIYSDAGEKTCAGMAGSLGHEAQDLDQFIDWEIDYLKYDNCFPSAKEVHTMDKLNSLLHIPSLYQFPSEQTRFDPMGEALMKAKSRRNITFELCLYGWGNVEEWAPKYGHLWRTSGDISDHWTSVLVNIDRNDELRFVANQGPKIGWSYPDALFIGKGGMTNTEYRTMFALWCAVKSPLMLGSDLRQMTTSDMAYKIITNQELLAVNQDKLGVQASCKKNCCSHGKFGGMYPAITCPGFQSSWQAWSGPLVNDSFVVIVINRYNHNTTIDLDWQQDAKIPEGTFSIRDLWSHQDLAVVDTKLQPVWTGQLDLHDNWAFKLTPYSP